MKIWFEILKLVWISIFCRRSNVKVFIGEGVINSAKCKLLIFLLNFWWTSGCWHRSGKYRVSKAASQLLIQDLASGYTTQLLKFFFFFNPFLVNVPILTLPVLCIQKIYIKIKINLRHLKSLHETFWGTTKKCENKNLSSFFLFVRDWDGKGLKASENTKRSKVFGISRGYKWEYWLEMNETQIGAGAMMLALSCLFVIHK